jgi:predicted dithiol-disulfide oxidoreductase (DUF899 family)
MSVSTDRPPVVDAATWAAAREALLAEEKALTRAQDALAARRRRLPRMVVTKPYAFIGPDGPATLADLFDGRRQLIVYHHMLRPSDPAPCPGCSMVGDQIPHLAHLHARDTSLVFVSRTPLAEIEAFRSRMGWTFPWVETTDDFNADFGVSTFGPGLNVFLRDGDAILRTYFTISRGVEALGSPWSFLDLTPFGRQELGEDAPPGTPQTARYSWWRLHDAYPVR